MININLGPEGVVDEFHPDPENTADLTIEQSKELLIKDFQIAREKLLVQKLELEKVGEPEDDLIKEDYYKLIFNINTELSRLNKNLKDLGVDIKESE